MANTTSLQSLFSQTYACTLAGLLAEHPSTTIADLREVVSQHPEVGELTLTELLGSSSASPRPVKAVTKAKGKVSKKVTAKPAPAAAKPAAAKPAAKSTPAATAGSWNVRTEAGRAALQQAVLQALRDHGGSEIRAEQLRSLGASPAQLRATLNGLIEDGAVTFSGRARGTSYSLA